MNWDDSPNFRVQPDDFKSGLQVGNEDDFNELIETEDNLKDQM